VYCFVGHFTYWKGLVSFLPGLNLCVMCFFVRSSRILYLGVCNVLLCPIQLLLAEETSSKEAWREQPRSSRTIWRTCLLHSCCWESYKDTQTQRRLKTG